MSERERITQLLSGLLPPNVMEAVGRLDEVSLCYLQEVRLRLGRGLSVTADNVSRYLCSDGGFSPYRSDITITENDMMYFLGRLFEDSLHTHRRELVEGYVTAPGGSRVGICGRACIDQGRIVNVKSISSAAVRIPREVKGCAMGIYHEMFSGGLCSLLICGAPGSGKTTLLRDLTRLIGDRHSISLIDERGEVAAAHHGRNGFDVGAFTDVFDGYSRYEGIMTAVRVMSPKVIVCDEIGSPEDIHALRYAQASGVKLIAACHCGSLEELPKKQILRELLAQSAFEKAVLLERGCVTQTSSVEELLCSGSQAV